MNKHELVPRVRAILKERGYETGSYPLESLAERIEETERSVLRKVRGYKWPGLILLALIPLLSTCISVLVTEKPKAVYSTNLLYGMSFTLTLLTVLNSIFRPSERFKEACRMGVDFERIRSDFLVELENLPRVGQAYAQQAKKQDEAHTEEARLHAVVGKFYKLVAPYQKELISMFLPEVAVEPGRNTTVAVGSGRIHEVPKRKAHVHH
jgi:hypothetical protein